MFKSITTNLETFLNSNPIERSRDEKTLTHIATIDKLSYHQIDEASLFLLRQFQELTVNFFRHKSQRCLLANCTYKDF